MLNFKLFYNEQNNLNEMVNILRSELQNKQIINLGKLGWWNVYSEKETDNPINRILTIPEYERLLASRQVVPDGLVSQINQLREMFNDAAYKLAYLGFPAMRQIVKFADIKSKNQITGGGVGGHADFSNHGIVISRDSIYLSVLIHEHAHMYWKNIPKANKEYFIKYYKENVSNPKKYDLKQLWKLKHGKFNVDLDENIIKYGWHEFKGIFEKYNETYIDIKTFFNLKNSIKNNDEQRIVRDCVLPYKGAHCIVKLKKTLNNEFKAGDLVDLERHELYIIQKVNRKSFNDEYPHPIQEEKIFETVEFKLEYLNNQQRERYENIIKLGEVKGFDFFAGKDKKELIESKFKESINSFVHHIKLNDAKLIKDGFSIRGIYNTWSSLISKRFSKNAINSEQDLIKAYVDAIKIKLRITDFEPDFSKERDKKWDSPDMAHWRSIAFNAGNVFTSYGAANVDELWATTVEHVALGIKDNKELVKLIYKTINGN